LNGNRGYLLTTFIRIEGPKPQMKPCRPTLQRSRAGGRVDSPCHCCYQATPWKHTGI